MNGRLLGALLLTACATSEPIDLPAASVGLASTRPSAAPAEPVANSDEAAASWEGGAISRAELEARVENELRSMEVKHRLAKYEVESQALEILVMEALLQAEVGKRGLADIDALMSIEVEQKVADPTDEEVEAFYPIVARNLRGATLEEARPMLMAELVRRAREQRYLAFIGELRAAAGTQVHLPYPELPRVEIPITDHDPVRGQVDAPVTVVQFAEYQCYYCNMVGPTLDKLLVDYKGKVRLVYKDYPLSTHGQAVPAAVAAHCAGEQGQYWQMSARLLANQQALEDADLLRHATALGLDTGAFGACQTDGRYELLIEEDARLGNSIGVEATPTFFVNGVLLSGAQPYERFAAVIDTELERLQ